MVYNNSSLIKKTRCVYCTNYSRLGRQFKKIKVLIKLPSGHYVSALAGVCDSCIIEYDLQKYVI